MNSKIEIIMDKITGGVMVAVATAAVMHAIAGTVDGLAMLEIVVAASLGVVGAFFWVR